MLAWVWPSLPERVPTHFNAAGEPDAWGSPITLVVLLGVSVGLWLGLTILQRFPHLYNFPWPITESNAAEQYRLMRSLLIWLKAELTWLFAYLTWGAVQTARGEVDGLNPLFLPIVIGGIIGTVILFLTRAARAR